MRYWDALSAPRLAIVYASVLIDTSILWFRVEQWSGNWTLSLDELPQGTRRGGRTGQARESATWWEPAGLRSTDMTQPTADQPGAPSGRAADLVWLLGKLSLRVGAHLEVESVLEEVVVGACMLTEARYGRSASSMSRVPSPNS